MLTELDIVNDCLALMGESPLNDVDEGHTLVPQIKRYLREELIKIQGSSWWFNKERVTLSPDVTSKFIYVPMDAISCTPVRKSGYEKLYVMRSRRLYNTQENTYEFDKPVECYLIRKVPFDDLPFNAQNLISIAVQKKFQQAFDADSQRIQQLAIDYQEAYGRLRQEDIRNKQVNFINQPTSLYEKAKIGWGSSLRGGDF